MSTGISACLESVCSVRDMYSELAAGLDYSLQELLEDFEEASLDRYDKRITLFQSQIEAVNDTETQVWIAHTCDTHTSAYAFIG